MRKNKFGGFSLIELMIVTLIISVLLGIVTQILGSIQRSYISQQQKMHAQENARVALDQMVRLIRMAGSDPLGINFEAIDPDPDANSLFDTIRIRADWNPADGLLNGRYEDVIFKGSGGKVYTREPSDLADIEFVEDVKSIAFTYFDATGAVISNPVTNAALIAQVQIAVETQVAGFPAEILTSTASVRVREQR